MLASWSITTLAKWACAYAGAVWGLFWMPLREMQAAGLDPLWSTALFFAVPGLAFLPLLPFRLRQLGAGGLRLQRSALLAGGAMAIYALAVTQTEVIRAMLLFYLTPLWSTLLARFVLGEPVTPVRGLAMALAFSGLLVITGIDVGPPLPRNLGDWLGLMSGVLWAGAAVSLRLDRSSSPLDITLSFFLWTTIPAVLLAVVLLTGDTSAALPALDALTELAWLIPILLLMVATGVFAVIWGPMHLDPGLVAFLFMTEITVGAVTAALWAGEPFGPREILGIALITAAALVEGTICGSPRSLQSRRFVHRELRMTLDGNELNRRLVELAQSNDTRFWRVDYEVLSAPERIFRSVWELEAEVNNGGFQQYFSNSTGELAPEAVAALRAIGANAMASIVESAIQTVGSNTPWTDEAGRQATLDQLSPRATNELENLDQRFFAYPDNLTKLLYSYVATHRKEIGVSDQF